MKDLRAAMDAAAELTAQYELYVLNGVHPHKSVQDVLWMFKEYLNKNITVLELNEPLPHNSIKGFYLCKHDGTYDVVLAVGLEIEWKRFVLCKELFHILLDQAEYRTTNIYDHLEEVTTAFPMLESRPGPAVISEAMAEFAAMEFLFPYSARKQELAAAGAGSVDYAQIVAKYRIPQLYVERYLSPPYMEYFGAFMGQ
jgi:Zn-dependent peptidase ImmA (M78 family)